MLQSPAIERPAPSADAMFQEALTLHSQGLLADADRLYQAALQAHPDHLATTLSWAMLCATDGRPEQGLGLVRRVLSWNPVSATARCCIGDVLQLLHLPEEASQQYRAALAIDAQCIAAYEGLGSALAATGRAHEALLCWQAALSLRPDWPEAQVNLGNTLQTLHRHDEAIASYEAALAAAPRLVAAHTNLANALRAVGRYGEAVARYRAALSIQADSPETHNGLGSALGALGRYDEAAACYEEALRLRPGYADALNNRGNVDFALHHYQEASACYREALTADPGLVAAHNNLGSALQELDRFDEARLAHEAALRLDPSNVQVHQSLAILWLKRGDLDRAREHGRQGLGNGVERVPYRGTDAPCAVLVLVSALGGNVRVDNWLDGAPFARTTVTMEFWDDQAELPPHQVVFNSIGEADRCGYALERVAALIARTSAPVLNAPSRVLASGRVENAGRLRAIPGVLTPRTALFKRQALAGRSGARLLARSGFEWPLLLRSPGYHTGEHFLKLDSSRELAAAARGLPGEDVLAMQYLDTFDELGRVRKYRVLTIDGQLYPLHLAVASHWMVHFLTADMADNPAHRAEDARFIEDMAGTLGRGAMDALANIAALLRLDYGGIDFSLDRDGQIVVWEANATMVAPPPAADERWDYRRPAVARITDAVRRMLLERSSVAAGAVDGRL